MARSPRTVASGLSGSSDPRAAKRRSSAIGAFFAEFVDMFDIYLPTVVLTPALVYFRPSNLSPGVEAILTSLVFATTLIGRPIGAIIFGVVADRLGRKRSTMISVAGFGILTLAIALVPGYATLGLASFWILIALRFLDGICLGGGYTGALPLAMEYSPKHKRGLLGGIILAAFPLAYIAINLCALAALAIFPLAGPDSPYAVWGWRIPFVIGALLAFLLFFYYKHKVSESEIWEASAGAASKSEKASAPLRELLRGKTGRTFVQVFTMMTGFWLTQNLVTLYLPTIVLPDLVGLSDTELNVTLLIAYACLVASYIGSGVLGQRFGRRRFFIAAGIGIVVAGTALLSVLVNGKDLPLPMIVLVVCAFSIIVTAPWGVILAYINERFRTDVRASGFGIGFSVSVVIPSFYAFYLAGLGDLIPNLPAAPILLAIGAILGTIGAAMGPETKDVDFTETRP
ncbi:MAG: MFS transporter [Streptosporangiales bacterium]|nr:MFS transporter [Streptosporangiales bacterium]